jgi:hypothetical protein
MGALLYGLSLLKQPIFKQKYGFKNISLCLNYCSIGSSRPPSCVTVPLTELLELYILFGYKMISHEVDFCLPNLSFTG